MAGMVVTDGRVVLGNALSGSPALAVVPRDVRVNKETLRSDERLDDLRTMAREARSGSRAPEVLPPDRQCFIETYTGLAPRHPHVVSMHYLASMDSAAREARICRQLMHPYQQIDVYEAKTLEGGFGFLLGTATKLSEDGATAAQLLALLHYLESHMHTFLLTPASAQSQPWASASALRRMASVTPGNETLWRFDPKGRKLVAVAQGIRLHSRIGQTLATRWEGLKFSPVVRHHGWKQTHLDALLKSMTAAGLADTHMEEVGATFLPHMPATYAELLLLPREADLGRLQALVQDPIWWKGGKS
jgi:hypothetical protein